MVASAAYSLGPYFQEICEGGLSSWHQLGGLVTRLHLLFKDTPEMEEVVGSMRELGSKSL